MLGVEIHGNIRTGNDACRKDMTIVVTNRAALRKKIITYTGSPR